MDRRNNRYFPVITAIFDRAADQIDVDQDAGARKIDQIRDADRRHLEAALLLGDHQPLGGKVRQRLAQRREARAIGQPQRIELEHLAGLQPAGHDFAAHPMRDIGSERLSEFLSALEGRHVHVNSLSDKPPTLSV